MLFLVFFFQARRHTAAVWCIEVTELFIFSGGRDNIIIQWDRFTGKYCRSFEGHKDMVYSVKFRQSDQSIFSASGDKTIRMWSPWEVHIIFHCF